GTQANILVVNPSVPAHSMAELIALAKAKPGQLNFASSGHGAAAHLAGELFKTEAKVDIVHVAYKGAAPALHDVVAGHVHMMFAPAASVVGLIKDGKVRPLAVTTPKRTAVLPDIPTVAEEGIPGFDATTWHGLVAPAGASSEVIGTLHFALVTALNDPAVKKSLMDLGVDIIGGTPKEFEAYIKAEIPKRPAVIKASGAQLEGQRGADERQRNPLSNPIGGVRLRLTPLDDPPIDRNQRTIREDHDVQEEGGGRGRDRRGVLGNAACAGGRLSCQADHADDRICPGWPERRAGAHYHPEDGGGSQTAIRDRESSRPRWQHCRQP